MSKKYPVNDPHSDKYPDRLFYGGAWRTLEQINRIKERQRVENVSPEIATLRRRQKNARYRERFDNDPAFRERKIMAGRIESWSPERIARRNERQRDRYASDPDLKKRTNERTSRLAREKRQTDPWFCLRATQASREWRARKREERILGFRKDT